jgi:hypothetical protein
MRDYNGLKGDFLLALVTKDFDGGGLKEFFKSLKASIFVKSLLVSCLVERVFGFTVDGL